MNQNDRSVFACAGVCVVVCLLLPAGYGMQFHDVTDQTGISFVHTDGSSGKRYIVETVTAGVALFDFDNDGDIDLYFLNGAALKGTQAKTVARNALYRNDGGWKFTDVTESTGVGDPGYGLGVAIGDYDNDGHRDIYVNNFGPNVLYRNNGDGTFEDRTRAAQVANGDQVGAGAAFLDIDGDGDLDLYAANYVDFTYDNHQTCRFNGYPAYVGPMNFNGTPDTLFRNNGDGTFTDISEASGIAAHPGTGMGMVCADYDNDGDTDVFVGNDVAGNSIFENNGKGQFEEVGLMTGLAYDYSGTPQGTMGVDCGDFNNDGLLDFYVTSYQRDLATLYRNMGDGLFEDVTQVTGAGDGS
ncbi:MAG: VCBS repeat-containing protein, partial [Planctomycetes bacterium]|nr:VCBS repeat-containing protein [Planctomycetota bacterium]